MARSQPKSLKEPPLYAVTSVDHALRLAVILQLEGFITVSAAAERLGVARSTAHRLLSTLVYRDFAVQNENRVYRAGPVLEIATHTQAGAGSLRAAALEPMRRLVDALGETANLSIRTGTTVRFLASVESSQVLRVGSREGMVFPAHLVTGGLVMLAALSDEQVAALYSEERFAERLEERPDLAALRKDLRAVRRSGIALNLERSERGLVAVGRGVLDRDGDTIAAISVSMPRVRYEPERVGVIATALAACGAAIAKELGGGS